MLNSVLGLIFSILGLILAKIPTFGLLSKVLSVICLLMFVVALIQCLVAFLSSFHNQNVFKFVFGLSGLALSIYGLVKYQSMFQIILKLF